MTDALSVGDVIRDSDFNEYRLKRIENHPSGILSDDLIFERESVEYRMPEPMVILMIENGTYEVLGTVVQDFFVGGILEYQNAIDFNFWTVRELKELSVTVLEEIYHCCIESPSAGDVK